LFVFKVLDLKRLNTLSRYSASLSDVLARHRITVFSTNNNNNKLHFFNSCSTVSLSNQWNLHCLRGYEITLHLSELYVFSVTAVLWWLYRARVGHNGRVLTPPSDASPQRWASTVLMVIAFGKTAVVK